MNPDFAGIFPRRARHLAPRARGLPRARKRPRRSLFVDRARGKLAFFFRGVSVARASSRPRETSSAAARSSGLPTVERSRLANGSDAASRAEVAVARVGERRHGGGDASARAHGVVSRSTSRGAVARGEDRAGKAARLRPENRGRGVRPHRRRARERGASRAARARGFFSTLRARILSMFCKKSTSRTGATSRSRARSTRRKVTRRRCGRTAARVLSVRHRRGHSNRVSLAGAGATRHARRPRATRPVAA